MKRNSAWAMIGVGLAGCSSGGPTAFNPNSISADVGETQIAFTADGAETMFAIDDEQLVAGFTSGTNDAGDRVFAYQNEDSAAVLLTENAGMVTPYYARLTDNYDRPSGDAEATGIYAGAAYQGENLLLSDIQGNFVITADFDENKVSGTITDRTGYVPGLPFLFTLSGDIQLGTSSIDAAGRFSGGATFISDDEESGVGTYEGVYIGTEGDAVAGQLTIEEERLDPFSDDLAPYIETGVFVTE